MFKKIATTIFILFVLGAIGCIVVFYFLCNAIFIYQTPKTFALTISKGANLTTIADELASNQAINSKYALLGYCYLFSDCRNIMPGDHQIEEGYYLGDILDELSKNEEKEVKLTFPEGKTNQEIADKLISGSLLTQADYTQALSNPENIKLLPFAPKEENYEGFLFPDTYLFSDKLTPEQIIKKFYDNFSTKWQALKIPDKRQNNLSDYEMLILASIIEKEAKNSSERKIISGILHNRLENDIPFGANATLNYVLPESKAFFDGYETSYESPYNTYKYKGLPPTPICNPGLDSINAAFNPETTDYLFFVHTPDGNTYFSRTYEEHQDNIAKYYN